MLCITDFDPKGIISGVRVQAGLYFDMVDADRSPNAVSVHAGPRTREGGRHGETGPGKGLGLHQRKRGAGGASGAKNFFVAVGDGAPETDDVFALSEEDRGTSVRSALCCSAGIDD